MSSEVDRRLNRYANFMIADLITADRGEEKCEPLLIRRAEYWSDPAHGFPAVPLNAEKPPFCSINYINLPKFNFHLDKIVREE
jgi:hypothetical protein